MGLGTVLLITGIASGLSKLVSGIAKGESAKKQAERLRSQSENIDKQLNQIKDFVQRNQIDPDEAYRRIARIFEEAEPAIKQSIMDNTALAVQELQDNYQFSTRELSRELESFNTAMDRESNAFRRQWGEGFKELSDKLTRGRLDRTEFAMAAAAKSKEKLTAGVRQLTQQRAEVEKRFAEKQSDLSMRVGQEIANARQRATLAIAQQMAQLRLQAGLSGEQARQQAQQQQLALEQFGLTAGLEATQQKQLLETTAGTLEAEGTAGAYLGEALGGLTTGLGEVLPGYIYGKEKGLL